MTNKDDIDRIMKVFETLGAFKKQEKYAETLKKSMNYSKETAPLKVGMFQKLIQSHPGKLAAGVAVGAGGALALKKILSKKDME